MTHEFVEFIPEHLADDTLYISMKYKAARHKCACGCGNIIITPITPVNWQIMFDGKGVSLSPSIGNWNFPCRSHYWITNSKIVWAKDWSRSKSDVTKETLPTKVEKDFPSKSKTRSWRFLISHKFQLINSYLKVIYSEVKNWHWLSRHNRM